MYFRPHFQYICPVTNQPMILGILFVLAATLLSRTTTPPHHDTWEAIETKANRK